VNPLGSVRLRKAAPSFPSDGIERLNSRPCSVSCCLEIFVQNMQDSIPRRRFALSLSRIRAINANRHSAIVKLSVRFAEFALCHGDNLLRWRKRVKYYPGCIPNIRETLFYTTDSIPGTLERRKILSRIEVSTSQPYPSKNGIWWKVLKPVRRLWCDYETTIPLRLFG